MTRQARPALPRGDHLHGGLKPIGKIAGQKCFSVFSQTAKDQPRLVFCVAGLALLLAISNFGADAGGGCCIVIPDRRDRGGRLTNKSRLPNSSIKGYGVRVFLSGRDRLYRQDFHAQTKLLPQTVQSPSRPGVPATWSNDFQRSNPSRHQRQRYPKVATDLPDQSPATLPAFVPVQAAPKRATEETVIISLLLGDKSITVKWPASDPDGCACFIRGLAQ
jgi:hypothetical protein